MKKSILKMIACTAILEVVLSGAMAGSVYATNIDETILQDTQNTIIRKVENKDDVLTKTTLNKKNNANLGATLSSRYSLQDVIPSNVVVRDQKQTSSCWAFASLSSLETNLALQNYKNGNNTDKVYDFSERHMDYATSRIFAGNTQNLIGFNRTAGSGGNWEFAQVYLTNGLGAISETSMPFENNGDTIDISQIQNKEVISTVYDTIDFDNYNVADDDEQKMEIINQVKEHIQKYGSVFAQITTGSLLPWMSNEEYYNSRTGAFFYPNNNSLMINHAVSIIGWDDNYSISNFAQANRPTQKGAWIVRNTWGKNTGDNGLIYVSYEDGTIGTGMHGIIKASDTVDYDNLYQYDNFMWNVQFYLNSTQIMLCNIFDKETNDTEYITGISLYLPGKYTCRAYVNPIGTGKTKSDLQLVSLKEGESKTVDRGYHTLEFSEPVRIIGDKFVIAVEIKGENYPYVAVETKDTELNDAVEVEKEKCFVGRVRSEFDYFSNSSIYDDGNVSQWYDLGDLSSQAEGLSNGDSTLKALTVFASNPIIQNLQILKGDLNRDGKITATDLLMMKRRIVKLEKTTANDIERGDMNSDGKITATDLLILKKKIVGLIT